MNTNKIILQASQISIGYSHKKEKKKENLLR